MASGLAGKWMRFAKSSTYFKVTRCRSNLRAQWVETTNAESPPGSGVCAEEFVYNTFGGDVDIDVVYKPSDPTGGLYAALTPGTENTVTFYPDKTAVAINLTGTLCVETFELGAEIKGAQTARISGKFTGGYTVNSTL